MHSARLNILLDLDGTLTDSRPGIEACLRHALDKLEHTLHADIDMQQFMGPPLRDTFSQLFGCDPNADRVNQAIAAYRERFSVTGMYENSVYDRIPEALQALRAGGANLYVATAKLRIFAERILEHFGLASHFRAIHGSELDGTRAEKTDLIAHILASEGLDPSSTVMIGDRRHDMIGARANNVRPIGVLWGYGSREELSSAGATALLAHPDELPGVLLDER